MPETQNKELFFRKESNQTPISHAFLKSDYGTANNLFGVFLKLAPSSEEIFQALNHSDNETSKKLEILSNARNNTAEGLEFVNALQRALGFRNFLTQIQKREPDWQTAREWAEDDKEQERKDSQGLRQLKTEALGANTTQVSENLKFELSSEPLPVIPPQDTPTNPVLLCPHQESFLEALFKNNATSTILQRT